MKLSDFLLADSVWSDLGQNRRLDELESYSRSGAVGRAQTDIALRKVIATQSAQVKSLAGAVTVLSATVDLLGELVVEKGVVDEAEFYDRLIDVVTTAQSHQENVAAEQAAEQVRVVCVWCGKKVPQSEASQVATGFACAPCDKRHGH